MTQDKEAVSPEASKEPEEQIKSSGKTEVPKADDKTDQRSADTTGKFTRRQTNWIAFSGISNAILAIIAFIVAFWQLNAQWQIQNEQAAREGFRDLLKVSMDRPHLSHPDLLDREYNDLEAEQYFWYMTLMNETFEQVLAHVPSVEAWIDLAYVQIDLHCIFYYSDEYIPELYSKEFQDLVDEVKADLPLKDCQEPYSGEYEDFVD